MTKKNPEYDFKWCPGCGDFGVKRAIEMALKQRTTQKEIPIENTVVVAGIGCSGNLVHLLDGDQPFGFHGIHGRTLPVSLGIKMANPELDVLIVAGDGDFLSIGMEHIAPQAQRNLNVTCVIMDNGVYGLTKGQSSPTTDVGMITPTTPYGKVEGKINPLELYLTMGVPFISSVLSSNVRGMTQMIDQAMDYEGFAIVHVQSPCTTYNDTYDQLKGNEKKGIIPMMWDIPDEHDPTDLGSAYEVVRTKGIPHGIVYRAEDPVPMHSRLEEVVAKVKPRSVADLINSFQYDF